MKFRSVLVAAMMVCASGTAFAEQCPISFTGQNILDAIKPGAFVANCSDPQNGKDGADGINGKDGANGINGRDFNFSDALAVSAAHPQLYLSDSESYALSSSLGFAEDATAVGIGGVMRLDKNWSAYASGAMSTEHSDIWSGNVGARFAW